MLLVDLYFACKVWEKPVSLPCDFVSYCSVYETFMIATCHNKHLELRQQLITFYIQTVAMFIYKASILQII